MLGYLVLFAYVVIAVFAFRSIIRMLSTNLHCLDGLDVALALFGAFYWPVVWPIAYITLVPEAPNKNKFARLKRWAGVK